MYPCKFGNLHQLVQEVGIVLQTPTPWICTDIYVQYVHSPLLAGHYFYGLRAFCHCYCRKHIYAAWTIIEQFAFQNYCLSDLSILRPISSDASVTGWERTGQMLCKVDTSLSVLLTLRMCLREMCCLFTVWIYTTW